LKGPGSDILCVVKPSGWSSYDVIRHAKKKWNVRQVGHTGTLDPMAEGVLILCFGYATKLAGVFLDLPKKYYAAIRFGVTTDTDDITGEIIAEGDFSSLNESDIELTAQKFIGDIDQLPPKFSALKIDGKPAYVNARKGKEVTLEKRPVSIYNLRICKLCLPQVEVEIDCSSGTYIRSIARDWGDTVCIS